MPFTRTLNRRSYESALATYGVYAAALAVRGVEVAGKLGLYMLAARVLGIHASGLFFLCITFSTMVATFARAGLEKAGTRHVAAELALGEGEAARSAMLRALGWSTLFGIGLSVLTAAAAKPLSDHVFKDPDLAHGLALSALLILPLNLSIMAGHILAGLKRGIASQLVQNSLWPALTLLALLLGADRLDTLLFSLAAAMTASALLGAVLIYERRAVFRRTITGTAAALPSLWQTALPLGIVELNQIALISLPVLLLGMVAEPASVGAFSVANRISILIWVVIVSIGTVAAPLFAEHHRRGEMDALRSLNRRVRGAVAVFGLPAIAAMTAFPGPLLNLIGPGFDIAATALVIMAVGQFVNCLLPCQDVVLAMTGHGSRLRLLNIGQFAAAAILAAVLIPLYGMNGAAIVAAVSIAQGAVGTTWTVRRVMPQAF